MRVDAIGGRRDGSGPYRHKQHDALAGVAACRRDFAASLVF
jgi:hypothetical protein